MNETNVTLLLFIVLVVLLTKKKPPLAHNFRRLLFRIKDLGLTVCRSTFSRHIIR